MTRLKFTTFINAPIERCFDISRSIDVHMHTTKRTGEKAVSGKMSGLIEKGEVVTWEAVHFGIRQRLTSRIVDMQRPSYFSDEMVEGAFKSMFHEHRFESKDGGTLMTDDFSYETPYGVFGKLFDVVVLKNYMLGFIKERNAAIKHMAEGDDWREILK